MDPASVIVPETRADVAAEHLWLHLWTGALVSAGLYACVAVVVTQPSNGIELGNCLTSALVFWLMACVGATIVGVLRLPVMQWLVKQACKRQWAVGRLMQASAALFLVPLLILLPLGKFWRGMSIISLIVSLPFLATYVAAAYWLRRRIGTSQPVDV
jgi:hypothetical protein